MRLFIFALLASIATAPVVAQGPAPVGLRPIARSQFMVPSQTHTTSDSLPRTHWDTGMGIGAGIGFLGGLGIQAFVSGICDSSSCRGFRPVAFLLPMAIFAIIGGLIGSAFSKA